MVSVVLVIMIDLLGMMMMTTMVLLVLGPGVHTLMATEADSYIVVTPGHYNNNSLSDHFRDISTLFGSLHLDYVLF